MTTEVLTVKDGAKIHVARFEPQGEIRGAVQFVHGFGEHAGRYAELAERFTARGLAFVIHDQRGHGSTPGKRGVAPKYDCFLCDVDEVRDHIEKWYPGGKPVFLYGHSMGGNISINYLLDRSQTRHVCAVISSPWLRLYKPFPGVVTTLARVLGKVSVGLTITNKLILEHLTHDTEIVGNTSRDNAYHSNLSFKLFGEITRRGETAIARASDIKLPMLVLEAGSDLIVSPQAIEEFAGGLGTNATLLRYPEQYHELHNELNRESIFEDVWQFLSRFIS